MSHQRDDAEANTEALTPQGHCWSEEARVGQTLTRKATSGGRNVEEYFITLVDASGAPYATRYRYARQTASKFVLGDAVGVVKSTREETYFVPRFDAFKHLSQVFIDVRDASPALSDVPYVDTVDATQAFLYLAPTWSSITSDGITLLPNYVQLFGASRTSSGSIKGAGVVTDSGCAVGAVEGVTVFRNPSWVFVGQIEENTTQRVMDACRKPVVMPDYHLDTAKVVEEVTFHEFIHLFRVNYLYGVKNKSEPTGHCDQQAYAGSVFCLMHVPNGKNRVENATLGDGNVNMHVNKANPKDSEYTEIRDAVDPLDFTGAQK